MGRERILVVDRDSPERAGLCASLREQGFEVLEAAATGEAIGALARFAPDAVVANAAISEIDGPALVARARAAGCDAAFVLATDPDVIEPVVAAMRAGADSYLVKPLVPLYVALVVEKALEKRRLRRESGDLREQVRRRYSLVGSSSEMQIANDVIRTVAPTRATVLVVGESGTGRRLVAQALHEASPRRDRSLACVNCAAFSEVLLESELFGHERGAFTDASSRREGKLEQADGGTVFLHEVASLSPPLQVRLVRVLEEGRFERMGGSETLEADVRVVASTSRDLAGEVKAGRFRADLYYRLNVVAVHLPPLRRRKGDIPALVSHFIDLHAGGCGIGRLTPGARSALFAYGWPGNVRELETVIEQAVRSCRGAELGAGDLSPLLPGAGPGDGRGNGLIPGATLFEIEREAILRTLEVVGGSPARAAEVLGVSVRKIQYRLKEYQAGEIAKGRHPAVTAFCASGRRS